jgi:hypothetical protein
MAGDADRPGGDGGGSQLERRRMSERRPIPPMQYVSTEDGHANHG